MQQQQMPTNIFFQSDANPDINFNSTQTQLRSPSSKTKLDPYKILGISKD